jgi:linoleoyl-CoA desaturase
VHYPKLAPIVKQTAQDFGIEYHVERTYWQALKGHVKMLKKLGRE